MHCSWLFRKARVTRWACTKVWSGRPKEVNRTGNNFWLATCRTVTAASISKTISTPIRAGPAVTLGRVRAAPPEEFETSALIGFLADGWGFDVDSAEYTAVGAGGYHWIVRDRKGTRAFVTIDELDRKPWLKDKRESVFDGLRRAFDTAAALHDSGLGFVVAPIPTNRGETLRRIGQRHTISVFPFVAGQAGRFGHYDTFERAAVANMLAELHRATPAVASVAGITGVELPGRRQIEAALQELNQTWSGGPFSEPARQALAVHASDVAELLALADRLAADVERRGGEWVVTHGEPHASNVMRTGESYVLVDWDTVALAPPERDLWMVVGDTGDAATIYADATGHEIDEAAVDFFRLTWDLKDLATCIDVMRAPHHRSEDTLREFEGLRTCVAIRDQWAALLE
jgi:spectinomycin phosphotransferase